MNIFYLDKCPIKAAQAQCDKHVVKMVLETAQLLCTTQRHYGNNDACLYKATHVNHPSAVWARAEYNNYRWLYDHFLALCAEYEHRFYKTHKCYELRSALRHSPPKIPHHRWMPQPMPQCMPDEFKVDGDSVQAYRNYYKLGKAKTIDMRWTRRPMPEWMKT